MRRKQCNGRIQHCVRGIVMMCMLRHDAWCCASEIAFGRLVVIKAEASELKQMGRPDSSIAHSRCVGRWHARKEPLI